MKFRCRTEILRERVGIVSDVIPPRELLPILSNIRIDVGDTVMLSATDLEVGIKTELTDASALESGSLLVGGKLLSNILRFATEDEAELKQVDEHLVIKLGQSEYTLYSRDVEDFPEFAEFKDEERISIPSEDLLFMIDYTEFAAAKEPSRYDFHGLFLSIEPPTSSRGKFAVEMVGTDGRRMALVSKKLSVKTEGEPKKHECIIPTKALREVRKLVDTESEEAVDFNIRDKQIVIRTKEGTVSSQLFTGMYPDYKAVLKQEHNKKLTIRASDFLRLLNRAAVAASEPLYEVACQFEEKKMTLSARSELGVAHIEAEVNYEGDPLTIVLQPALFTDALRRIGDDEITIEFTDEATPCTVHWGKEYTFLSIPIVPAK